MASRVLLAGDGWALDTPLFFEGEERCLLAEAPEQLGGVLSLLDDVADSKDPDLIAIGFIAYEAGVWLEGSTALFRKPEGTPLAAFGIHRLRNATRRAPPSPTGRLRFEEGSPATPEISLSPDEWAWGVDAIRDGIARGDVYQVNLTRRTRHALHAEPFALARALYEENPVPYAITVAAAGWAVVSNSPELFLDGDLGARRAASAPIKGTIARGETPADDAVAREQLLASAKDAAEHVMIVDLIRNDLGRVASPGGVAAPPRPTLRSFRHLHHLESTVEARLAPGTRLSDLLRAMLPGGSVTGAPKHAALGFIRRLEAVPRGAYTGAAGYVRGDGRVVLNVAIRTTILHGSKVDYHAGGGIVWDSTADTEWRETETKSREFEAVLRPGRLAHGRG
ncbi:MAG TPA: anthranilate synthase component I family protein [Thermoanaerobaculia bacterium]|nr:anthranilate synthase component I family protein [Thermoanaerobaculia bacterium]